MTRLCPFSTPALLSVKPAGSEPEMIAQVYGGVPLIAENVCEYAAPTAPAGSGEGVTIASAVGLLIVKVRALDAVEPTWSVTCTVKLLVPAVVGVPYNWLMFRVKPAGSVPEMMAQVYCGVPPLAPSDPMYVVPTVPGNSELVVIHSAELIVKANALDAVALALSVTCTVKLLVPDALGVPLNTPAPLRVKPAGREPEITVQEVYGGVPLIAESVCEYAMFTVPAGSGELVAIASAAEEIVKANARDTVAPTLSAACTVKLFVPDVLGVPLNTPEPLKVKPAGRAPEITVQVYGGVPPVAQSACVYAVPNVPGASGEVVVIDSTAWPTSG